LTSRYSVDAMVGEYVRVLDETIPPQAASHDR
jgi:hypothetical protein